MSDVVWTDPNVGRNFVSMADVLRANERGKQDAIYRDLQAGQALRAQQESQQNRDTLDYMRLLNQDRQASEALRQNADLFGKEMENRLAIAKLRPLDWHSNELRFADEERRRQGKVAEGNLNASLNQAYDTYWNQYMNAPTLFKAAGYKTPDEFRRSIRSTYETAKSALVQQATPMGIVWDDLAVDEKGRKGRFVFPDAGSIHSAVNPPINPQPAPDLGGFVPQGRLMDQVPNPGFPASDIDRSMGMSGEIPFLPVETWMDRFTRKQKAREDFVNGAIDEATLRAILSN